MLRASTKTKTEAMEGNWSVRGRGTKHMVFDYMGGRDEKDGGAKDVAEISGLGAYVCWSLEQGTCQSR